jgi:hypothetical protein
MGDGADNAYDRAMDEMLYPDDYGYDPSDFEEELPLLFPEPARKRPSKKKRKVMKKKGTKRGRKD